MGWSDRRYHNLDAELRAAKPPAAVYLLLSILVATHLAIHILDRTGAWTQLQSVNGLGLSLAGLRRYEAWRFVTGIFVQVDTLHLLWTVLVIFVFGRVLERTRGAYETLVLGLGGAVLANGLVAIALVSGVIHSNVPIVGADGMAWALVASLLALAPRTRIAMGFADVALPWLVAVLVVLDFGITLRKDGMVQDALCRAQLLLSATGASAGLILALPILMRRPRRVQPAVLVRPESPEPIERPIPRAPFDEAELDRVLVKIADKGMDSLSDSERTFLKDASRRYQAARDH